LDLQLEYEKDKLYVQLKGELDLSIAPHLRIELDNALDTKQARHLIMDFSSVSFIDSSGLGVILGRYRRLTEVGGTVCVENTSPQVYKILEMSGLSKIIEITQSNVEADEKVE
jgi:stage II sporulation protein AA (anti-sigma F factor antagonist)